MSMSPSSFVFVFLIFHSEQVQRKKVCGKEILKSQGTYQRVRKVKIKIAASKADKTQSQYKGCLITKHSHFDQSQVNLSKKLGFHKHKQPTSECIQN